MEIEDRNNQAVGAFILILFFVILMAFLQYRNYEPISSPIATVVGQVLRYESGSGGKSASSPHFVVKLQNGSVVNIASRGNIPYTFKGKAVVNVHKRENTFGPYYTINVAETEKMHNKAF